MLEEITRKYKKKLREKDSYFINEKKKKKSLRLHSQIKSKQS
jgi:hypothetical protein